MLPRDLISGIIMAGIAATPTVAAFASGETSVASPVIVTSQTPAQYCVSSDAVTLKAIRQGNQSLAVVVHAFTPATSGNSGLVVSLLSADKTQRHEVGRFAVHPLRAFSRKEPHKQQRFLVTLDEHAHLLGDNEAICIEVGFDTRHGKLENGKVEFHVERVDVQTKPEK